MDLLTHTLDPLLRLFLPTPCVGCDTPAGPLCRPCAQDLGDLPLRADPGQGLRPLTLWLGPYKGLLRNLIRASKFRRHPFHGHRLASRLGEHLARRPGLLATTDALVVPPVEPERRLFHPAWLLAEHLGARLRLPVLPDLLRRHGSTRARHLAGRARAEHAARTLLPGRRVPAGIRRVALVDDLWTTGATARRMTTVLAGQGVEVVLWVFLARTPQRRRRPSRIPCPGGPHLCGGEKKRLDRTHGEPLKIALQAPGFA